MTTLQVQYDDHDATIRRLVQSLIESGIFMPVPQKDQVRKTGIEEADEDIREGRVYSAKDGEDLIRQCLQ